MNRIMIVTNAAIFQEDKYLLTKRYDPKDKLVHNRWQMPGGGLNFKESLIDGLRRELQEEIGPEVIIREMLPELYESISEREHWHGIIITFLCELKNQNSKIILNNEASDYGWFSLEEMRNMRLHYGTYLQLTLAEKTRKNLI